MTICCDVYPDDFTNIVIIVSLVIHGLLDVLCCFYFVAPVDCWGSGPVACTRYTALLFLRFRRMAAFPVLLLIVGALVLSRFALITTAPFMRMAAFFPCSCLLWGDWSCPVFLKIYRSIYAYGSVIPCSR